MPKQHRQQIDQNWWVTERTDLMLLPSFRCVQGYKLRDNTCVNENECMWLPCTNGGICKDADPPLMYHCLCPEDYTGINCELELARSGAIMPSRDFILAVIVCLLLLLGKFKRYKKMLIIVENNLKFSIHFCRLFRRLYVVKSLLQNHVKSKFCMRKKSFWVVIW